MAVSTGARRGDRFRALYSGEGLTEDASAHDQSLCNLIAPYSDHDESLIDEVFRSSKRYLYRDKWERQDYREKTIAYATSDSNPIRKHNTAIEAFRGMPVLDGNCVTLTRTKIVMVNISMLVHQTLAMTLIVFIP